MSQILLTEPVSRLSDATLIKILKDEEAWTHLSDERKTALYALLPPISSQQISPQDIHAHPLRHPVYGEEVRSFIAYIEEQIDNGMARKGALDEAMRAHRERSKGTYDDVKEAEREEYWGQKATSK